jgi:hypothetical protein
METEDCTLCGGEGWVCADHPHLPWAGTSTRADACNCGAEGAQCPQCNSESPTKKTGIVQLIGDTKHGVRH